MERRRKPTPSFGWYSFFGRRKQDHYSAPLFFSLVSITGLNVLDSLSTMMILDRKGWEANPIVRAVMESHGDNFWIWKFGLVSFCLILLCLHSRYKAVKRAMVFLTSVYLVTVVYQIYYLGMNLGNILIIEYTDHGYFQKCPWDCVLPNKIQSQEGKLSPNRMLLLLWPE